MFIVFDDATVRNYMMDRKWDMGKSQLINIDEVLNRTDRRLRLEKKYKVRRWDGARK